MCDLNNKKSFTLIEIVVVLIILGVLAAIALPNLFSNINNSRSAEALATFGTIKRSFDVCLNNYNNAWNDQCALDSSSSVSNRYGVYTLSGDRFRYVIEGGFQGASSNWQYNLYICNATAACDNSSNFLRVFRNPGGNIQCTGVYPYTNFC